MHRLKIALPYLGLLVLGLGLYAPLVSRSLYHADSVGFAFALHEFNLRLHHPQAPGYLPYVLLLRAVQALTGSSDQGSIVTISVMATIGAGMVFFALCRIWFDAVLSFL